MKQPSLLSDELVRRLIGVGQVDIVVGLPTLNHADIIRRSLAVIEQGLARYFPRARTLVMGADGGSNDGTLDVIAGGAAAAAVPRNSGLRTRHRIGASYHGVPGRAGAVRLIFTAADLLQANGIAICDPDTTELAPEWIGSLLQPIATQSLDVVAAADGRHPLEGLLVTQLMRPLMRAAYRRQLEQPLLGAFACSRPFAVACLVEEVWARSPIRDAIDVWLAGVALAGDYQIGEVPLGRFAPSLRRGAGLQAVFGSLVGALFSTLDKHASVWSRSDRASPPPVVAIGAAAAGDPEAPALDSSELGAAFGRDVWNLRPVLAHILSIETFASLSAIADKGGQTVHYDDETWVATVYDFAAAYHHGVIDRTHVVQALMPLYLGRAASFISEHAESPIADAEQHLERLSQLFERRRQYLIDRWRGTT